MRLDPGWPPASPPPSLPHPQAGLGCSLIHNGSRELCAHSLCGPRAPWGPPKLPRSHWPFPGGHRLAWPLTLPGVWSHRGSAHCCSTGALGTAPGPPVPSTEPRAWQGGWAAGLPHQPAEVPVSKRAVQGRVQGSPPAKARGGQGIARWCPPTWSPRRPTPLPCSQPWFVWQNPVHRIDGEAEARRPQPSPASFPSLPQLCSTSPAPGYSPHYLPGPHRDPSGDQVCGNLQAA